jgi:hypothetical protein
LTTNIGDATASEEPAGTGAGVLAVGLRMVFVYVTFALFMEEDLSGRQI